MDRDFSPQVAYPSHPDETECFRSHPRSSEETLQHLKNKQATQENRKRKTLSSFVCKKNNSDVKAFA